ncbi:hypothetical protein FOXG_20282 [Fusarium oxysporum f. sp. lycopersici 4287]|uniref:Uncharacterized protein n=1 Tax=Fusarium oxysporum f. sp. lycopersici (strain 4287 / CBS 123668 / FGSC 9935 / NRRL 34936) TaxID=426428 RepID=A0A0J9VF32_FUSO4|nr:hypothetical protein FOXG_20282 [Fusarium oxysporum f. sp. lycopersici 4287]KNB09909.1 hypothetical protein FOXG_20282 [Fusarium oxysporum f. sp. lycopersici 4287]
MTARFCALNNQRIWAMRTIGSFKTLLNGANLYPDLYLRMGFSYLRCPLIKLFLSSARCKEPCGTGPVLLHSIDSRLEIAIPELKANTNRKGILGWKCGRQSLWG